ncbi:hypothetical protein [Brevundimonas diminuta]|uniref:hypothetical protein n=1 Tax=Brevundimonas diminuta TaxID=293 RepID=UPI003D9A33D1
MDSVDRTRLDEAPAKKFFVSKLQLGINRRLDPAEDRSPMNFPNTQPIRHFTEGEFATIGKVMLLWGMHEQTVGTVVSIFHKTSGIATTELVHALGYSKKVDLASAALKVSGHNALARELQHIKRAFRPERDVLAHGAFGTWDGEAWVRALSKERFVLVDDFSLIHDRAYYAYAVALEAVQILQKYEGPRRERPPQPPEPNGQIPRAWEADS